MVDALAVMLSGEKTVEERAKTIGIIERRIDPRLIKQRDAGKGRSLDYISGSTVIRLLNEAFTYQWSFQVLGEELVTSVPKFNKYKNESEPQAPYVKVLGRLTVPGYGVKEQFGTQVVVGGAAEQEGAAKSAATDALKKCATLFGIGLELYEEEIPAESETDSSPAPQRKAAPQRQSDNTEDIGGQWDDDSIKKLRSEIDRLKDFKEKLGITEGNYDDLNPFVQDFLNNPKANYNAIGPKNIVQFNQYLEGKVKDLY